jgi:hypothetical protein
MENKLKNGFEVWSCIYAFSLQQASIEKIPALENTFKNRKMGHQAQRVGRNYRRQKSDPLNQNL